MAEYSYVPIDLDAGEIRLVKLQPGEFDDDLTVQFFHGVVPDRLLPDETLDLSPLQESLPPGWRVADTVDGNLIFVHNNERTSWAHPDPTYPYREEDWHVPRKPREGEPVYECLSYCWGPEQPEEMLLVVPGEAPPAIADASVDERPGSPQLHWKYITIRPNLALALRNIRHKHETRSLWIDAICIDQINLDERGRHVGRMGSIYNRASRVIVWLGAESEDSTKALESLELIGKQLELLNALSLPSPDGEHPDWIKYLPWDQATCLTVRTLFERPWFERLWIWQEIVLGHWGALVQCGQKVISWYDLRRGMVLIRETIFPDAKMRDGLMADPLLYFPYYRARYTESWDYGWMNAMHGTCQAKCHDPRDKVYALVGLCTSRLADNIKPDYTLTEKEVFISFVKAFLDEYKSLIPMRFCTLSTRQLDAPTWVPDLCNIVPHVTQLAFAAGNTAAVASIGEGDVLSALGVGAAVVRCVSDVQMGGPGDTPEQAFRAIKAWYALGREFASKEEPFALAVFSAMFFGWLRERLLVDNNEGLSSAEYQDLFERLEAAGSSPSEDVISSSILINRFFWAERRHVFIVTEDGKMGTAPLGTLAGDVVAVLLGLQFPIILRPAPDGTFKVVGPANIHGLIDAQAILGPIPAPWTVKIQRFGDALDIWRFHNEETGELTPQDPRLGPLPDGWVMLEKGDFQDQGTGVVTRLDPRCSLDELKRLGTDLRTFELQ